MILGNEQYTFAEEKNVINVILLHHPINWFLDEKEAYQYIKNNARVLMVGHEHTLNIETHKDQLTKREILHIFAGATNPPADPEYEYTYNGLEFSCDHLSEKPSLSLNIYPRIWVQEHVRFEPDHRRLGGGAEFITVTIECENLFPTRKETSISGSESSSAETVVSEASPNDALPVITRPTAEGEIPMTNSSQDFDKLRYLFWQYLDWQQRLTILVDADALPKTANQPVPQTLERIALENIAADQRKLHAMWESIMPLIPEQKRGPNPFEER